MLNLKYTIILLVATLGLAAHGFAQERQKVSGLADNTEYVELLEMEKQLRFQGDSLSSALDNLRDELRQNPQSRAKYGGKILELEASLFDVRSRIGTLTGRVSVIEQDYVLKSLEAGVTPVLGYRQGGGQQTRQTNTVSDLVKNSYFRRNLKPEDYQLLLESQAKEELLPGYLERYKNNYRTLTGIESLYAREKEPKKADSMYAVYSELSTLNLNIADSIDRDWKELSDNKMYIYSYLLEKMNRMDILTQIHGSVAQELNVEAENSGKYSSDAVAFYTMRKSLLLDVEMKMAELIGLDKAKDSLSRAHTAINSVSYTYEPIDLEEKLFIDFIPVSISAGKYSTKNPIPQIEIHDKGTIYRIQVGAHLRLAAVSLFKNLYPLSYHMGEDGKYRYYAGCYDDINLAIGGLALVKKTGFKDAFIVVWERGVSRSIGDGQAVKGKSSGVSYRVEIDTGGKNLPRAVHDIISNTGKELVKVGNTIVVGTYEVQLDAEKLVSQINDTDTGLTVRAVALEGQDK